MSEVNANGSYRVQEGDTLWRVANETGISIDELASVNGVNPDGIQAGMTLTIPARPTTHDASDPYARAGGIGEGQGSSPGQASETHLTGYLQSLTRDSTRSGKAEGGVDGGSQWERDAFLGSIGEKYRGQSVEQAKQGGLDRSRTQALEGATSEGEKVRINKAFDEAEQRIRGNTESERIGGKVKDGSLLGKTHEKTIENVQAEKTEALDGISDPRERARVGAAYDEAVKTLNANNDAHRASKTTGSVSPVISSTSSGARAYQDGGPGGTFDYLRVDGDFDAGIGRTGVRVEGSVLEATTDPSDTSALGDIRFKAGTAGAQLGHNTSGEGAATQSSYGVGFNLDAVSITKGFGRLQDGRNDTRGEAGLSVGVKSGGFNATIGDKDGDGSREVGLQVSIPLGPVGVTLGGETENTVVVGAVEKARDVLDSVKTGFKRLFG
ncbi:LysM peptidoglycan-binding domain-containing protein [Dokdonella sp.]|uniref:LysM peptidoglycan-binding domain-containing protein n=1 Tax=Dokdonella sp. TaxID=2291710 RepID=UPI001B19A997|nr:LysM peptidoglycan-binding domain-containing protein [Dokdonella sp.]MBO9663723.1 LysM peptidoglycan-binding domain-containing protein [Dokdonella sp.]